MSAAIGSDPEVFVLNKNAGLIVPVTGLVGGTKEEPLSLGNGYAVQEDGVALEYNIPPAQTVSAFMYNMASGLKLSEDKLPSGHTTVIKPDHEFLPEQLTEPSQWLSGCDPDYSAWTMEKRGSLDYEKSKHPYVRFCGGHVHISYDNPENYHPMTKVFITRCMDFLTALPCMWMEGNSIRKQEFGTFGIYRPKVYGLEYRTLSNIWIKYPELMEWVATCALHLGKYAANSERNADYLVRNNKIDGVESEHLHYLSNFNENNFMEWNSQINLYGLSIPADLNSLFDKKMDAMRINKDADNASALSTYINVKW
jgi:hypothetical protein